MEINTTVEPIQQPPMRLDVAEPKTLDIAPDIVIPKAIDLEVDGKSSSIRFERSDVSGDIIMHIKDDEGETVRTIPSEELARIIKKIQDYLNGDASAGILLDEIA